MPSDFKKIDTILKKVLYKHNLYGYYEEEEILSKWEEIIGKELSKICYPENYRNGILVIKVFDVSWRKELSDRKDQMIDLIKKNYRKSNVKKIIFI
jgi:hypothetical protein